MITIYTDGAYSPKRKQGGWSFVILKDNKLLYKGYGVVPNTTIGRMELLAPIQALNYCISVGIKECIIYSDSKYVIECASGNWQKTKNFDLWKKFNEIVKNIKIVEWNHVKGHEDSKWNNYCDLLANHASKLIING